MSTSSKIIIDFVRAHPCLYAKKHPQYKDIKYKQKLWEELAIVADCSGSECKIRWKSLRDRYTRGKRTNTQPMEWQKQWKYKKYLGFLDDSVDVVETPDDNVPLEFEEFFLDAEAPTPAQRSTSHYAAEQISRAARKSRQHGSRRSPIKRYLNFFHLLAEKFDVMQEDEVLKIQSDIFTLITNALLKKNKGYSSANVVSGWIK